MNAKTILVEAEERMKKTIDKVRNDFASVRTGRASMFLVDGIKVEYYGALTPLNQIAAINIPDAKTIEIRPWDKGVFPAAEKAIIKANIGINPQNDGKVIRLVLPQLTQERRQDLVKVVRKMSEEYRIGVRNERRDALELLRKTQKAGEITEDDKFNSEKDLQKIADGYIKQIDDILTGKEKEILEV
ncbi:MAG: ribosome recycling factor [Elusimicrobiota bacterium]